MGKTIDVAGSVKSRKADRHATSDWMAMEKQRGISITTSVMQFPYRGRMINLLDTPGMRTFPKIPLSHANRSGFGADAD